MRASLSTVACVTGLLAALAACETAADHKAAENAAINQQAGAEIARICGLHGAQREAQLKELKESSGMELMCPTE